jgi:group I intron endonuclease
MTAGVYAIVNTINGHRYIGSTKDFETRGKAHRTSLRSGSCYTNGRLAAAIREFGGAAFIVEMIEEVEPDDDALQEAERRWLMHFSAVDRGGLYNFDLTGRRQRRPAPRSGGGSEG